MGKSVKKKTRHSTTSAPYQMENPNKKKTNHFDNGERVLVPDIAPQKLVRKVNALKNKYAEMVDAVDEVWNTIPNEVMVQAVVASSDGDYVDVQFIRNARGDLFGKLYTYHVGFVARPGTTGAGDTGEEDNEELNDGVANEPEKKKKKKKPIRKQLGWRHKSSQSNKKKQHKQKKKVAKELDPDWDDSDAVNTDDDESINSDGGGSEVVTPKSKKKKATKKVSTSDGSRNNGKLTVDTRFSHTCNPNNVPTTMTGTIVSVPNKKGGNYTVKYDGDRKEYTIPESKLRSYKLLGSGGKGSNNEEEDEEKQYTKPKKNTGNIKTLWEDRVQQLKEYKVRYLDFVHMICLYPHIYSHPFLST